MVEMAAMPDENTNPDSAFVPQRQPVLDDLEIRIVDARVDQPRLFGGPFLPESVGEFEERLTVLCALERKMSTSGTGGISSTLPTTEGRTRSSS